MPQRFFLKGTDSFKTKTKQWEGIVPNPKCRPIQTKKRDLTHRKFEPKRYSKNYPRCTSNPQGNATLRTQISTDYNAANASFETSRPGPNQTCGNGFQYIQDISRVKDKRPQNQAALQTWTISSFHKAKGAGGRGEALKYTVSYCVISYHMILYILHYII